MKETLWLLGIHPKPYNDSQEWVPVPRAQRPSQGLYGYDSLPKKQNLFSRYNGLQRLHGYGGQGVHGLFSEIKIRSQLFHAPCSTIYYSFCLQLAAFHTLSLDYTYRTMWLIFGRSLWNLKTKFQTPTSDNMLFRRLEVMISLLLSLGKPC